MKRLNEYLSTKVKITKKFPDNPTIKNLVSWLNANDFVKYEIVGKYNENDELSNDAITTHKFFTKLEDLRFYVSRQTQEGPWKQKYAIVFCNGKPNKNNPAITIFASNEGIEKIGDRIGYTGSYVNIFNDINTIDEFKEFVYKYFENDLEI